MTIHPPSRRRAMVASVVLTVGTLAACGGTSPSATATTQAATAAAIAVSASTSSAAAAVLPVISNPITNTSTAEVLKIDSVLVENNVDSTTSKDAADHLEIALSNTGTSELSVFEVFYTFTDQTDGITESYYTALPADFTIAPGATRIAHFDNSGATDHFATNDFSLYKTSANAQDVTVEVSATGAAPQTLTVQKDAGGAETAD